jgi:cohesin domain
MKKIKVILATAIIAAMMLIYATNVFAAVTANITLTPRKTTVAPGEEFTVEVKAESIDAGANGITKIEGTLSYDNKVLNEITTDNQIEGMSGWKITFDNFSKKITATSTTAVKSNGPVFQISFKVRSDIAPASQTGQSGTTNNSGSGINLSGGNQQSLSVGGTGTGTNETSIEFKSIKLEGGLDQGTANDVSTKINIGQASQQQQNQQPQQQPSTPAPTVPTPAPSQQPSTPEPTQPSKNPKAGIEDAPIILMAALSIVATISFILLKKAK